MNTNMHWCIGAVVLWGKWGKSCIITWTWTCIWLGWWAWYGLWTQLICLANTMMLCLDVWDMLNVNVLLMLSYCDMLAALDEMR